MLTESYNAEPVVYRGGILKISELVLKAIMSDFFTGKKRIVNPGLELRGIKRIDTDFPLAFDEYEFSFSGDDLPIIEERCYPTTVVLKPVEYTKDCYRLVEI